MQQQQLRKQLHQRIVEPQQETGLILVIGLRFQNIQHSEID